ncbi:MAG TPA: type II toxin-antitoxin system RelE/ParE family toxin [Labilithrix sp.]|nr:type II toxin-antitoxin system RelE/ParE family toxin [Labilithrix sp.]
MNVRFTPEAQAQADECDTWWRQHRTARDLFARELAGIKEVLLSNPKLGTVYTILDGQPVRKVLMPKTHHHVYYAADFEADVIMIHAVWGAPREGVPEL